MIVILSVSKGVAIYWRKTYFTSCSEMVRDCLLSISVVTLFIYGLPPVPYKAGHDLPQRLAVSEEFFI